MHEDTIVFYVFMYHWLPLIRRVPPSGRVVVVVAGVGEGVCVCVWGGGVTGRGWLMHSEEKLWNGDRTKAINLNSTDSNENGVQTGSRR